jgi:raffinose/stachyose/melibiose transport system permease protein
MDAVSSQDTVALAKRRWPGWNEYTPTIIVFLFPTIFFISVFVLWPIISSFRLSFFEWNGIAPTKDMVGFHNWSRLIHDDVFWKAYKNNLRVVVLSIAIQIPLGIVLAMMLESVSHSLVGRIGAKFFKTIYFFPMLMSSVAIGILWKYIYDPSFGIVNSFLREVGLGTWARSWLGVPDLSLYAVIGVICWQYTPFYMILFLAALTGVPDELRDAARMDGANERQYYLRIALPLLRGTIRVAVVLSLVGSLKYFDLIWVMTEGGPSNASELMATYMYKKAFPSFEMGYGSTVASLFFIIVMVMSVTVFFVSRRFETEV